MSIPGITLVFKRSAAQEDALQELLAAQQNTASPLYHHWLTPDTFATRFGIADQDIAATETWLQSHGFHIDNTAPSRDRITFSGTAEQVQTAFGTQLHSYRANGELHFAPSSDLTLPAELVPLTAAVLHLSSFRPKPNYKTRTRPHPDYTTLSTQAHYLAPPDIFTMYDLNGLFQTVTPATGQSLAVVGQSYVNTSNPSPILDFNTVFRGSSVTSVLVPVSGVEAILPGDEGESEIDLEYASSIASGANVFFVYVGDNQNYNVFDSLAFAIAQDVAPVISISYSVCESLMSATEMDQGNALFEQAAAQGQTLVAASGDAGSTACAFYNPASGVSITQIQALSVGYPADSPYVTAVGGTQMAAGTFAAGPSSYWATASNFDATSSLLSYVSEVVWNEGSASDGIAASGGGPSTHFPRPAWQSGLQGIPPGAFRLLPDIALQASIHSPGYLICSDDDSLLDSQTSSCGNGLKGSDGQYTIAGGTSFAAPIFAGFVAILNQVEHASGQGNINPVLYSLASNPASYAAAFHDITSGTNACPAGAHNCAAPGESGYATTLGYDEATGLGSIDFGHLIAAWPANSAASLIPTLTTIGYGQYTAAPGANVPVQIFVNSLDSPRAPVPIGVVEISLDGVLVEPSLAFSVINPSDLTAQINYTFIAPATSGSHLLSVYYPGDATHASSTATYSLLVGNVMASGNFSLMAPNLTLANGATGTTQVTVTPSGGYNGRIVWSLSSSSSTGTVSVCSEIGSPSISGTSTTPLTIGVGSACNSPFPAVRGNLRPIATLASSRDESPSPWRRAPGATLSAGLLLCASIFGRRRRSLLPQLLAIAILTVTSISLIGCGGASGSNSGTAGSTPTTTVPPTAYTITLTGKDSVNTSITASTAFTLTVN